VLRLKPPAGFEPATWLITNLAVSNALGEIVPLFYLHGKPAFALPLSDAESTGLASSVASDSANISSR